MLLFWVLFNVSIFLLLLFDMKSSGRSGGALSLKQALFRSAEWIGLAAAFGVGVYFFRGPEAALQFAAGYLIEKSLSVDNLFVFMMLFTYFKVPAAYQPRVLFFGILGAIVMRTIFIFAGVALIERFHWIIYLFGLFLVYTGAKMATGKNEEIDPEQNPALRWVRRWLPTTPEYRGERFFVREGGRWLATPLFIVLLTVETTDLIFAVDSIPAVLAISNDFFIVYTSNIFAILGLRALYFALAGMMQMFHYLNYGLAAILIFVGAKMLLSNVYHIPIGVSLGVVACALALAIAASLWLPPPPPAKDEHR